MATSTIRKAIGTVKDQASISLAKVAGNVSPDLEVLVVKATTHDNEPADDKYAKQILNMISYSSGYVNACVFAILKRLRKTSDWIVALKALMLVNKLLNEGDPIFGQELMLANRKGARVLNMSGFRDFAHSSSWDHSGFVRTFALYVDQKLEFMVYERKLSGGDDEKKRYDDEYLIEPMRERNVVTPVRELGADRALERLNQLLRLFDRFLASRPTGAAKKTRMVLVALHLLVKESFKLYADISDVLKYILDCFSELEYAHRVKAFDAYVNASKMIDGLIGFYDWFKDTGFISSSEFPEIQGISDNVLGSLEGLLRGRANRPKSPRGESSPEIEEEKEQTMNEVKALPRPDNHNRSSSTTPTPLDKPQNQEPTEDLVNFSDYRISADQQSEKLALAFFCGPVSANTNGEWVDFSGDGESKVTSAWQNPTAESGKGGWELALVESTSNLSNQKAELGGGFDPLLLDGIYDQGTMKQHAYGHQLYSGSASSIALQGTGMATMPILALPGPDGTVQPVGQQDPFAASLSVPPPPYVQIADMERKQQLLMQEQRLWQQYASNGMQGQYYNTTY